MSNLEPYRPAAVISRTGRAMSRINSETALSMVLSGAQAEIESAKIDAIASVASRALQDVALLSQIEQSLAQAVPHASGRLAAISDLTAIALADSVATAARRIGQS